MPGLLLPNSLQTQISKESNQNLNASIFQLPPCPPPKKYQKGQLLLKEKFNVAGNSPARGEGVMSTFVCYYLRYFLPEQHSKVPPTCPGEEQAGQGSTHSSGLPVPHSSHVCTCDPKHV